MAGKNADSLRKREKEAQKWEAGKGRGPAGSNVSRQRRSVSNVVGNWLHDSLRDKPRSWVVTQLYARIDSDKRRGGDYAVMARVNEEIVKEHRMKGGPAPP